MQKYSGVAKNIFENVVDFAGKTIIVTGESKSILKKCDRRQAAGVWFSEEFEFECLPLAEFWEICIWN